MKTLLTASFSLVVFLLSMPFFLFAQGTAVSSSTDDFAELLRIESERVDLFEKTAQAVIAVFPAEEDAPPGGGSGVVISPDGYALTNFHVVQPCGIAMKCGMPDGKVYNAVLVGVDPTGDIALIKLLGRDDFPCAKLGDSDLVRIGDEAIVMGNPFLLALDYKPCISFGVISGTHRYQFPMGTLLEYTDCIQTDAAVNPGNSGGPIFNAVGELIGINGRCSFEKRGRINVGIGYAVSINQCKFFLGDLKSGRIVDHANANVSVITDRIGRVLVDDILPRSELYKRGVKYNDEFIRFAGRPLDTANTFKNLIGIFPKDWQVPVTIRTADGTRHELLVRLSGLHSDGELIEMTEQMLQPPIPQLEPKEKSEKPQIPGLPQIPIPGLPELKRPDQKEQDKEQKNQEQPEIKVAPKPIFVPDWAKPFYEKRKGFANYYFNRLELDRVLKKWRKDNLRLDEKVKEGKWLMTGPFSGTDNYKIEVDNIGVKFDFVKGILGWLADVKFESEAVDDRIMYYQAPLGSGGMFAALYLLQQLASNEKNDFGEVTYVGTAPLGGDFSKLYDVVSVVWKTVRARFYFEPETSQLRLIELYADEDDFPCEVWFNNKNDKPEMEVVYGTIPFAKLAIDDSPLKFAAATAETGTDLVAGNNASSDENDTQRKLRASDERVITETQQRIVKIYGSGGLTGMQGYQTGCIISPDGYILTVISPTLEADPISVVCENGRRFDAKLVEADPVMEFAILKVDGENLPYFNLAEEARAAAQSDTTTGNSDETGVKGVTGGINTAGDKSGVNIGDRIFAVSNPFNISVGNEPASVQRGIISAKTTLRARRGVFETPYKGPIWVVDAITNNPGAKGGVVVLENSGRLVGIIGKELRNAENNTWLNFVLPSESVYESVKKLLES
ncbi:MAG: S1C family serine protease, partial [Thermoguttaceae bacterium]